ncbi:MAG: transcriptional repressor [Bacteroidetes bacterium]|nr:transcriptional repressor [Bacteroidota bacterium]
MATVHQEESIALLKAHGLSVTGGRKDILVIFLSRKGALAHADIEKKLGARYDRVTIYRTLQSFVDKGLIHSIPTNDNSIRYALCKDECASGHHHDHHVHFVCKRCDNTYCLDSVATPSIKLPKGYSINQVEMVVSGQCPSCQ